MERRSMWSRLLAIVLAVSMVFSSQSMSVFADTLAIIQQPQDTNEKKNQPADDTSKDNQETSEESEEETTAAEEPQQSEPAEESSEAQQEQTVQMTGTINGENVNLRSEPSTSSEVLSKAQTGDVVSILGEVTGDDGNTWYEILYGQGSAFVSAEFVTVTEAESESETEAATEPETAAEEETQSEAAKKAARNDSKEADNSTVAEKVLEQAEKYWGDNATEERVDVASLFVVRTDNKGEKVEAGETLSFNVDYTLNPAMIYSYSGREQPMYDTYDNTVIHITLPRGLKVQTGDLKKATVSGSSETGEWTFTLKDTTIGAASSTNNSFTFNVLVEGNGTLEVGHLFGVDDKLIQASIETQFSVKDKSDSGQNQVVKTYTKEYEGTVNGSNAPVTSKSDDVWAIDKTAKGYTVSEDKEKVTLNFDLEVGFLNPAYTEGGDTKKVLSDKDNYAVTGRTKFSKFDLTETLELKDRNGDVVTPESITVTPKFGEQKPISFTNGTPVVSVPVDTCEGKGLTGVTVDGNAPYYSQYSVAVVYDYDTFIANWYEPEKQDDLTVNNTASISYLLNGESGAPHMDQASASQSLGEVNEPASLTIQKKIQLYDGTTTKIYGSGENWNWGMVSGDAVFTIQKVDGDQLSPAKLYQQESDGSYTLLEGNTVALNPVSSDESNQDYALTSADGTATVYLEPGTYQITETDEPENTTYLNVTGLDQAEDVEKGGRSTISAGASVTAVFTNEAEVGKIEITKKGERGGETKALGGAKFALYTDQSCTQPVKNALGEDVTGTTSNDGTLTFHGLAVKDESIVYYVKETAAPEGYILKSTVYDVTVPRNGTGTLEVTNQYNTAYVKLQKRVEKYDDGKYQFVNVDQSNFSQFANAFTLEESKDNGESWNDVTGFVNQSINDSGVWAPINPLPVYDENGDPIQYRFKEKLPDGWHGKDEQNGYVYTEAFTLETVCGKGQKDAHTEIMQNTQNAAITLTKKFVTMEGDGEQKTSNANADQASFTLYKKVGEKSLEEVSKETTKDGVISFTDLAIRENEQDITYYLEEQAVPGYKLELGSDKGNLSILTIDGKTVIGPITFAKTENRLVSFTAYNVEQKLPVKIVKQDSTTTREVPGAEFTVEITYQTADAEGKKTETRTGVASGSVLLLDGVRTPTSLTVTETKAPEGYQLADQPKTFNIQDASVTQGQQILEFIFEDHPYREVTIQKTVEGNKVTTPVTFEVYTRGQDGNFVPVTGSDEKTKTLISGGKLRLPEGVYYLHEVVPEGNPNEILDPDQFPEKYAEKGEYKDGKFFFGPMKEVPKADGKITEVIDWGTIDNISSVGNVTVTKKEGVKGAALAGATIQIYHYENDKQIVDRTVDTDPKGNATFTGLPVYGTDGKKITYYIVETAAPNGYYINKETSKDPKGNKYHLSTTLVEGKTVTKVNGEESGKDLTIINNPKRDFMITKVARDLWENQFTQKDQLVNGAVVALYRAESADGPYTLQGTQTTGATGQVAWKDLEDGYYVAVEVSCPDVNGKETRPQGGKAYLADRYPEKLPETLDKDELGQYLYVTLDDNKDTEATLVNEIGWTQLKVEKVCNTPEKHEDNHLNGALFELYKQVLPEGTPDNAALNYQQAEKENALTLVGTYSSGTLSDSEGKIMDGWFATDILETGTNIVYWLVEKEAPSGHEIIPEEKYILFKQTGTEYTNSSDNNQAKKVVDYPIDGVAQVTVTNKHKEGPGDDRFAYIRLYKWADDNGTYKPLGGVKYKLYLADKNGALRQELDEMTTGLESTAVGEGTLTGMAASNRLDFNDFKEQVDDDNSYNIAWWEEYDSETKTGSGKFYVRMALVETYAPFGYRADATPHYLIVCFEENQVVYDETYFVSEAGGDAPLASSLTGYPEEGKSYRLTNEPLDYYSVTVQKFGYTPDESTLNKTSAELDGMRAHGSLSAVPLSVTMRLQRKVGNNWEYCDPNTSKSTTIDGAEFTTTGGQFTFPNGLMEGSYRIIEEESDDAGYELLYNDEDHARYFEVTGQGTIVTMYNPSKFSLSLKKTDWDEKPVTEGVTFTLKNDKGQDAKGAGTAVFTNLGSGSYKLTEEAAGYSNKYLTAYFQETYPQAVNLVNGTGLYIGYDKTKTSETDKDVTITAIHSPESYGLSGTVTVKNPKLGSLTIEKRNADDHTLIASDEFQFTVYYQAFDKVNGEYQAQEMPLKDQEPFGTYSTTDGTVTIPNLQPGVYYIEETSAPAGFEKDSTPQYVAITGGMDVTVTVGEQNITTDPEEAISFLDTPQGSLTVTKEINWKSLDPEMQAKEYSFTFTLYDKAGNQVGTAATVTQEKPSVSFTGLKRGETYYLQEAPASGYALESVKQGNGILTADEENRYPVAIGKTNATDDVAVTVTNAYQYAQYTFKKVDGTDNTPLKGAKFTIKKVEGEGDAAKETVVQGVTWTDHEDGSYTVKVPLSEEGTYRIYETKTPSSDYLLDETQYLEVTLEPGDKKGGTAGDVMENFKGAFIEVTKYGNMEEAKNPSVLQGAGFTLYERKPGESWSLSQNEVLTDKEGKVRFTVNTGCEYALAETKIPGGYSRLQGIWNGEQKITAETLTDGTILYNLGSDWTLGETYSYEAYNVPNNLELEVRKYDADQEVLPKATVSVYEVPDTTSVQLSQQEVINLMSTSTALATDVQTTLSKTGEDGRDYSYADKTVAKEFGTLESGKTYLIVETGVTAFDDTPYPMTMDDDRVVWYKVLPIPAGETDKQIVELTNVREEMDLQLTKTAVVKDQEEGQTLPSLFEKGQEIDYTLTPQVTNGFALDSFTLKDPGLTAYGMDGKKLADALKNKYTITSLTIGQASYDASDLSYTGTPDIQATVTFKDFEGNPVGEPQTVSVSGGAASVPIPSSAEGTKIASVEITYIDGALQKATGYALGKDFKPGSVNLTVKLDQQTGGSDAKEISKIVNSANAVLTYRGWTGPTSRTETMNKTADNAATTTFGTLKIPSAAVSKVLAEGQEEEITLGDSVEYLLTLENTSLDDAALEQAVLADVLPEGTSVDTSIDYAVITGENPSNLKISQLRQVVFGTNTAILIYFDGNLDKGDSVQIKMTVQTSQSAALYGTTMKNAVFATSAKPGVVTEENKAGASFKGNKDNWAESLSSVATGIIGENRTLALCEALESERFYGFISSHKDVSWNASSTLTLSKSNYGSEDEVGSYRSDRLARTTDNGAVYYQLAVTNNDPNLYRTGMTIMDVLPREGDLAGKSGASRESQWPLYFEGITSVTAGGKTVNGYEVYYYTGSVDKSTFQAVRDAQDGVPSGWTKSMPDKKEITAFIINLKDTSLAPNENLVVQYTAKVKDYTPEDGSHSPEELEKLLAEYREDGYTNAVNNFSFFFKSYMGEENKDQAYAANEELVSNTVSATLIPGKVKVGGHVWIDADDNGTQDDGSISQYSGYDIVKNLLDQIEIKLLKYNDKKSGLEGLTSSGSETYNQQSDPNWHNAAHFIFSNLDPAYPMGETPLYNGTDLNVGDLKGDNPATYILQATLPQDIADVFELAKWGGSFISREPGEIPPDEQIDSNFDGDSASSSSERFYLWQISTDNNFDDTKDIGFTLHRDLTIEKTAADDANTKVEGATFNVYGPFEEGTAAKQNIDKLIKDGKSVATGTTGDDGSVRIENLLWFKEYIIVETDPSSGYTVEGAGAGIDYGTGTVTPITGEDGAWVLEIPDEKFTGVEQNMSVTNKRQTEVSFNVTKILHGRDALKNDEFTFELLETPDSEEPISTVTIKATKDPETGKFIFPTGTFAPVTLTGVRSDDNPFTYYIRERIPTDAEDNGITYDTTMYQVQVTTSWESSEITGPDGKPITTYSLKADTPEYKVYDETSGKATGDNVGAASFTNIYTAAGSWPPTGTKTLTGRDMAEGETYTFNVYEVTTVDGKEVKSSEPVSSASVTGASKDETQPLTFTPISYQLDDLGSHTYEIREELPETQLDGVTYDSNYYRVTVMVADLGNGKITATPSKYTKYDKDGKQVEGEFTSAGFVNDYKPVSVTYNPQVTKSIDLVSEEPIPTEKTFSFTLTPNSANPEGAVLPDGKTSLTAEVTVKAGETTAEPVGFGNITFNKAGIYLFTIEEDTLDGNDYTGYTKDNAVWTLTVVVEERNYHLEETHSYLASLEDGTEKSNETAAAFINKYEPTPATKAPTVKKTVTGDVPETETNREFTFILAEDETADNPEGGATLPAKTELKLKAGDEKAFDDITFTKSGTYRFKITEKKKTVKPDDPKFDEAPGYTYDGRTWTWTVVIEDNDGMLNIASQVYRCVSDSGEITGGPGGPAEFVNTYKPREAGYQPKVTKVLTGANVPEGKDKNFTFKLTANGNYTAEQVTIPGTDGNPMAIPTGGLTVSCTGSGDASFANMTFKKAGTYSFTIVEEDFKKEDADAYKGYRKDGSRWTLTVTVTDTAGVLNAVGKYERTTAQIPEGVTDTGIVTTPNEESAVFVNDYKVTPTNYAPAVSKTVTKEPVPEGQEKEFEFTLTANTENPDDATLPSDTTLKTGVTAENQPAKFGEIQFTAAGSYSFTITEKDLEVADYPGYEKDTVVWTVTVQVEDIGGELQVEEVTYTSNKGTTLTGTSAAASFENTYSTEPEYFTPKVSKTLTGAKLPEDKTFEFKLETISENPEGGAKFLGETKTKITYKKGYSDGKNPKAEEASFGKIEFTKAGTYEYLITETSKSGNGFTCDTSRWKLTVVVVDEAHVLKATGTYVKLATEGDSEIEIEGTKNGNAASFENDYSVNPAHYTPKVDKTFIENGQDRPDETKTFSFTLTQPETQTGASISVNGDKAVVTDDGEGSFGVITFTEAKEYTFTITEDELPEEDDEHKYHGYTKDPSIWTLKVTVVDQGGQLKVAENGIQYSKSDSADTSNQQATFTNTYLPDATYYQPKAKKTMEGILPEGGETFEFTLSSNNSPDKDGYVMPKDTTASVSIPEGRYDGRTEIELTDPFGSIHFTKAGEYNFTITETDAGKPGYAYGGTWNLKVTVTDENGRLKASALYTKDDETSEKSAIFRNTYEPGTTSYQPKVDKTLTGTIPTDATFTFSLTDTNEPGTTGYTMPEDQEAAVTFGKGAHDGEKKLRDIFGNITFSEAGTYTFQIEETTEAKAGYQYDPAIWTLTVTVEDNNGTLNHTVTYTADGKEDQTGDEAAAEFANSYTILKGTEYAPIVAKNVTGEVPDGQEKEFTFTLDYKDGKVQAGAKLPEEKTLTTGETEEAEFGNIQFTAAGKYTFTITENPLNAADYPGYGHDDSIWELTVVVVDENAKLRVDSVAYSKEGLEKPAKKATFVNPYEITEEAKYQPSVTKKLTGEVDIPTDKTFTFNLSAMPDNPNGATLPENKSVNITFQKGAHTVILGAAFDEITFQRADTYKFKIEEDRTAQNGYGYDTRYWIVTVKVTDTASKLNVAEVTYEQFNADGTKVTRENPAANAEFVNSYTVISAEFEPKVSKIFSKDSDVRPSDNEKTFTFTLQAAEGNPDGASVSGDQKLTTQVVDENTNVFEKINFTKAGEYKFTIKEQDDKAAGYSYDTRTWTLKVTVVDEGGALKVDEEKTGYFIENTEISRTDFAEFENEYHVTSTTYEPTVNKEFTADSDERPEENQKTFTFAIRQTAGDLAGVNITNHICTVTGEGSGTFGEGAIEFTKAGIYTFEIKEQPLTEGMYDGYTADPDPWTLTVEVEDRESKLTVSSVEYVKGSEKSEEEATFTNEYHLTETAEAPLGVEKVMTGDLQRDVNFTFHMSAEETEGIVMPTDTTAVITIPAGEYEEETFTTEFEKIKFTKAGDYHFTITEQDDNAAGFSYDSSVWTAVVKVVDRESVLEVESVSYSKQTTVEGEPTAVTYEQAVFTNSYSTVETSYAPRVEKVFNGSARPDEKEFRFTLTASENNDDGASLEAGSSMETAVLGEGFATFETITFTKAGTYQFTIRENEVTLPGYADYDTSEWTLTVEVKDVDHILTETHSYTRTAGGEDLTQDEEATFDNNYSVTPDTYQPRVTKEVTGTPAVNEEFHFTISAAEEYESVLLPEETEVTIEGNGEAEFGEITFQAAGTYYFNIAETAGEGSYTYDESQWTLVVTVEDHDSVLEATAVYQRNGETVEGAEAAAFENNYRASGEVLLDNFTKTLNGSPLAAGQFTFQLKDEEGNVLQTVTNAADGSIPFEAVTYDESDIGQEYTYTVSEVNNNVTGVAYDTTIYTVIVAVADSENSDGTLDITTTILNGEETIEGEEGALPQITFTNTFGGTVTLTKQNDSQQVLAGAEFQLYARTEGADTYEVYASEGNAEGRYTTDVNGQIQITDLPANDYYFVETRAPQGYVIETDEAGQPLHYDFTIGVQDGVAGIAENAVVNAALTVTNDGATTGSIQVTKRVGRIGDNFDIVDLIAVNETYYVGLFLDAAGTQPYGTDNVKAIQMNGVSVSEAVTFDNLPSGTYYVLETDAQGNPIVMNETQTTADGGSYYCTLEEGQNNQVTVDLTVSEEPGTVMLTNVYLEFSEDYYWDATIDITKRVLRNGEEATADDTFYAGVYQMLEDGSYELLTEVELQQNDTVTVTGLGGPIGESMTYYVFETDGNGNRVSEDPAFRYAVSGEGSVTVTQDNTAGSITITNEYEEEEPTEEPSEKPTEKPSEKPTEPTTKSTDAKDTEPTTTTSTKATKTGDTTDLTVELLLMAVAAVLMGTSVYARKRRRNRR